MTAGQIDTFHVEEIVGATWRGQTVLDRLYGPTVRTESGCLERTTHRGPKGYTHISFEGKEWRAHRLAWELENGPIGDLTIDHLCRNTSCIELSHLEVVTLEENSRRRHGWIDGTCGKGHDITDPTNVVDMGKHRRRCRPCWNQYMRNFRAERAEG
jgi:hypothetical protein